MQELREVKHTEIADMKDFSLNPTFCHLTEGLQASRQDVSNFPCNFSHFSQEASKMEHRIDIRGRQLL